MNIFLNSCMELIKPLEITSKIMSLISEAERYVVIVSPYYNLTKWIKFKNVIEKAKKKGVEFTFYVRQGEAMSINEVKMLGFVPFEIERLHAKLYFNESSAIMTSINLNISFDNDSLDIGTISVNEDEYNKIASYFIKHILAVSNNPNKKIELFKVNSNSNIVQPILSNKLKSESSISSENPFFFFDPKFNAIENFHLPSLFKILKKEFPNESPEIVNTKKQIYTLRKITIPDFIEYDIEIDINKIISVNFLDTEMYYHFRSLYMGKVEDEFSGARLYWNKNVINIYEPKGNEFEMTEDGLREKVGLFLFIIRKISVMIKKAKF